MVSPSSEVALSNAAQLLGCDVSDMREALISRVMQATKAGAKGTIIK